MKFTVPGKDVIRIDEDDFDSGEIVESDNKVHLIKLDFLTPTSEKIKWVLNAYNLTNRYIIDNNIRIYNNFLKKTNKKYYIENNEDDKLISFFKKNNKVLLNFLKLNKASLEFVMQDCFEDVLYNTEVIIINQEIYEMKQETINLWKGNVIIQNDYSL